MRRVARHLSPAAPLTRRPDEVPTRPIDVLLDWIALHGEPDLADPRAERISLLTLHAAKGLEWKVVFLVGCEQGLLPYVRPGSDPDLDEERRLFFVGMTRAERLLVLSWAKERTLHGHRGPRDPSPFIADIDPALLRADRSGVPRKRRQAGKQLDLF
jgi:superfamily I DNA/RNA helicase